MQKEQASPADPADPADLQAKADKYVAEGKKAIALKQWEEGVNKYGDALDIMKELVDDFDPKMAPLLLSYGKALYELAFSQQGVMGKEEVDKTAEAAQVEEDDEADPAASKFTFAEPTFEEDTQAPGGGAEAGPSGGEEQEQEQEQEQEAEGEVDEPEDDYNAAWEVLDVARTIYAKMVEDLQPGVEGKEERLCLAECYLALGDVSCETENFPQAVNDYSAALDIKSKLLPPHSRALASVHYQLATVLEFTPNRRADALSHVEAALAAFNALVTELSRAKPSAGETETKADAEKREAELNDVKGLIGDLEVKIEELKSAPEAPEDFVSESINHLLGQGFGSGSGAKEEKDSGPVNDLTSMVKKKPAKKAVPPAATNGSDGKRKAEDPIVPSTEGEEKKQRVE